MISQQWVSPGPGDTLYTMRVVMFVVLLGMGYALSRPPKAPKSDSVPLVALTELATGMLPWQRRASEKAVDRYTAAQAKKWQRWSNAMFERSE